MVKVTKSKSAVIRELIAVHPDASPKELVALAKKNPGVSINTQLVYSVKHALAHRANTGEKPAETATVEKRQRVIRLATPIQVGSRMYRQLTKSQAIRNAAAAVKRPNASNEVIAAKVKKLYDIDVTPSAVKSVLAKTRMLTAPLALGGDSAGEQPLQVQQLKRTKRYIDEMGGLPAAKAAIALWTEIAG